MVRLELKPMSGEQTAVVHFAALLTGDYFSFAIRSAFLREFDPRMKLNTG